MLTQVIVQGEHQPRLPTITQRKIIAAAEAMTEIKNGEEGLWSQPKVSECGR